MKSFRVFFNQSKFMIESQINTKIALYKLGKILNENKINYCIIGSIVMIHHNYIRYTEDIDILVDTKDKELLLDLPAGQIRTFDNTQRKIRLVNPSTNIDVIYSGDTGDDKVVFSFPLPNLVSENIKVNNIFIPFLSLKNLILFKLRSGIYAKGRLSDLGDIQKLIQLNNLPITFCNDLRSDLKEKYIELFKT